MWIYLRHRYLKGYKFRRQQPIGRYVVDFFCCEKGLIIEIDGPHHEEQKVYDTKREQWLRRWNYRILRFSVEELERDGDAVLKMIVKALEE